MKKLFDQPCFRSELVGWAWRGIFCAVPSAVWAVLGGFTRPLQIAAMALGVGCYIAAFAIGSTWLCTHPTPARVQFSRAMKIAAAIKSATLVGAAGAWAVSIGLPTKMTGWLFLLVLPDLYLGMGSMGLVGLLRWVGASTEIARQNLFALTGLITLLQGAFLSVLLAFIALVLLAAQRAWLWAKRRHFFPAAV